MERYKIVDRTLHGTRIIEVEDHGEFMCTIFSADGREGFGCATSKRQAYDDARNDLSMPASESRYADAGETRY